MVGPKTAVLLTQYVTAGMGETDLPKLMDGQIFKAKQILLLLSSSSSPQSTFVHSCAELEKAINMIQNPLSLECCWLLQESWTI